MIYEIKKNLHNDFSVFQQNKLEPRSYAIPFSDADKLRHTDLREERYASDMAQCLSGEWDFKFYDSVHKLPDRLDTLKTKFSTVAIPSDWQRTGFQPPVYLNCPYEFKTLEPNVPDDMPVGVYRRFFEAKAGGVYILSFLGVANNLSLYVNGKYVGYSEGSHNTAEFNVTGLVREGVNELVAVSFKWCNGSFLEAQDMFRENGIFRDVLLYRYGPVYLRDYEIVTEKTRGGWQLTVNASVEGEPEGYTICVELASPAGKMLEGAGVPAAPEAKISFLVPGANEWNPETPHCYYLYITLKNAETAITVRQLVGFRAIEIRGSVFYFNGKPVKLLGVNHHDTNLYKGYVMSFEDMEKDITLMKSLNVNAVRTSHYPPDPFFLTLADLYGLYVIDEADIETHGCGEMFGDMSYLSKQAKWVSHYVDRVKRMYYRDRNHPSITMWSLGNESGGYKCQDACYDFLKSTGTRIPVHYESVIHTKRFHYDVISEMYTSTEEIERMIEGKRKRSYHGEKPKLCREYNEYPFFLCEYAHAMGVGPGNLKEYVDLMLGWETSMGGCIWEWADHAVYHPDGEKHFKYRYTYGGDHGEKQHDGNFCVDGLMFADRRLHTGAKEMKVAYRPIRASYEGNGTFRFTNIRRFVGSDDIDITWVKLVNGEETARGELSLVIPPMKSKTAKLRLGAIDGAKDCHVSFIYTDRYAGTEIAVEQIALSDVPMEYDIPIAEEIALQVTSDRYTVAFEDGEAVFTKLGDLISYKVHGKELLASDAAPAFSPNLFRALIDNDAANRDLWRNAGLDHLKKAVEDVDVSVDDWSVTVTVSSVLKSGRTPLYGFLISCSVSGLGAIEVHTELKPLCAEAPVDIPRFGLTLGLTPSFENVSYYGRGTAENMPDFNIQAPVGVYEAKVRELFDPYVYPQESGMHCDVKRLTLSGADGKLTIYADDKLAFSAHPFTQEAILRARHQEDLSDMGLTFLTLDGMVRGIGSSSCGPDTRKEYRLDCSKGFEFSFTVIPE